MRCRRPASSRRTRARRRSRPCSRVSQIANRHSGLASGRPSYSVPSRSTVTRLKRASTRPRSRSSTPAGCCTTMPHNDAAAVGRRGPPDRRPPHHRQLGPQAGRLLARGADLPRCLEALAVFRYTPKEETRSVELTEDNWTGPRPARFQAAGRVALKVTTPPELEGHGRLTAIRRTPHARNPRLASPPPTPTGSAVGSRACQRR